MKRFIVALPLLLFAFLVCMMQTAFADAPLNLHLGFNTISSKLSIVCYSSTATTPTAVTSRDVLPFSYDVGGVPKEPYDGLQPLTGGVDDNGVATAHTVAAIGTHTSTTVWADLVTPPSGSGAGNVGLMFKSATSDVSYVFVYQSDSKFVLYKANGNGDIISQIVTDNKVVPYAPSTQYRLQGQLMNGVLTMTVTDPQGKSSTISASIPTDTYNTGIYLDKDSQVKKFSDTSAVGMDGYAPEVTSVLVNGSYTNGYAKDYAVDKDFTTAWNAGGYSGWLQLNFKNPETFSEIQVAAQASPSTVEDYTIYGLKGSNWTQIGTFSPTIYVGSKATITPHMVVVVGTYDALKIAVNGRSSWVAINEIHLIK